MRCRQKCTLDTWGRGYNFKFLFYTQQFRFLGITKVFAHMHKGGARTPCSEAWWEVMESGKLLNKRMRSPHGRLGSSVRTRQKCVHWLQRRPSREAGGRACCINTTRPAVHLRVCSPRMRIVLLSPSTCISELVLLPSTFSLCRPTRNACGFWSQGSSSPALFTFSRCSVWCL